MPLTDVKFVNMPKYDELSVKNIWPHCKQIPELMKFFPDSLPKNRLPDREYFFNILNTCNQEYVKGLIDHALKMRNSAEGFNFETESISISQNMIDILSAAPFISCKYFRHLIFV